MGDVVQFPGDPHRALARAALRRLAANETKKPQLLEKWINAKPDFSRLPTPEPPSKWLQRLREIEATKIKEPKE